MRIVLKQWLTDSDSCDKVYNVAKRFQQIISQAAVAQSVERRIGSAEVTGPIPVSSFKKPLICKGFFHVYPFFNLHYLSENDSVSTQ